MRIAWRRLCVLVLCGATLGPEGAHANSLRNSILKCAAIKAHSAEAVVFNTLDDDNRPVPVRALLSRPKGPGPFPAVVVLHRYFGVLPPHCYEEGRKIFHNAGYVVLLVDSDSVVHAGRGRGQSINDYSFEHQSRDAMMAHVYLFKLPFVDRKRIALVGYAYGGSTALRGLFPTASNEERPDVPFAAIVAWHPHCPDQLWSLDVPLMVIAGGRDTLNWPYQRCKAMRRHGAAASKFELVLLPNAGHNFDAWFERNYDAAATRTAYQHLATFLDKHLTAGRLK
jgi:dienelactone hydrolase